MGMKRGKAKAVKPRPPLAVYPHLAAHPRLVHGFLVPPRRVRTAMPEGPIAGLEGLAAIFAHVAATDMPGREGPADDTTFH
jgi:hypothetical protein